MKVTTRKRGSKWEFRLHGNGVPNASQQMNRGGFLTEADAQRAGREVLRTIERGIYVAPSTDTVDGFLRWWLDTRRGSLKPTSIAAYTHAIEVVAIPRLGSIKLQELRPEQVAKLYADLLTNGRADGSGGLSVKSVRNVGIVLQRAFKDAERWNKVARNPFGLVDLPIARPRAMRTWTLQQVSAFLSATTDTRNAPIWRLFLTTGMRRGEVAALRWHHVDLDRGVLAIEATRSYAGSEIVEQSPKTISGRREIALDPSTVEALRAWRKAQAIERVAAGEEWRGAASRELDYVVTNPNGSAPSPSTLSKQWNRDVKRAGLPAIRLHDARHTYATIALVELGMPVKVVSERLGHADVSVTLKLYVHVSPEDDRRVAAAVAAAFDGGGIRAVRA